VAPRTRPAVPMLPDRDSVARTRSSRFRGKRKGSAGHSLARRSRLSGRARADDRALLGRVGVRAASDIVQPAWLVRYVRAVPGERRVLRAVPRGMS
jgi:hypothetical protein